MTFELHRHFALVGLQSDLTRGERLVRQIIKEYESRFEVHGVSCVYKRNSENVNKTVYSELVCVIKISTTVEVEELRSAINSINIEFAGSEGTLLSLDRMVQMLPTLTLPNPKLANDPTILRCASEIWGEYEHPILGQTLNELITSDLSYQKVEFYLQGSKLL